MHGVRVEISDWDKHQWFSVDVTWSTCTGRHLPASLRVSSVWAPASSVWAHWMAPLQRQCWPLPWNAALSSPSHLWSLMIDGLPSLGRKSLVVPHLSCPGREKATWLPLCLSFLYFFNSNAFSEDVVSNSCPSRNVSCKLIFLLKAFGKKHSYHYTFLSSCFVTMADLFTDLDKGWAWLLHPCEDIFVLAIDV